MNENSLKIDLIVKYKEIFPWESLSDAKVITSKGQEMRVIKVELRNFPTGPLFELEHLYPPENENTALYNITAFEKGIFKEIHPTKGQMGTINKFIDWAYPTEIKEKSNIKSCFFDLLLFDLDGTLVLSSHLDHFRGKENVNNKSPAYLDMLASEVEKLFYVIPEKTIAELRATFPQLKLGIFTRAPKAYALTILTKCYPNIRWDSVVAYEDVNKTKPNPEGIYLAARWTNISDINRIALIGDESSDIVAAYQAGAFSVLSTCSWGNWKGPDNPKKTDCYNAKKLHPDATIEKLSDLNNILTTPENYALALERLSLVGHNSSLAKDTRIDTHNHFTPIEDSSNWVEVKVFGRYFTQHNIDSRYDFRNKANNHELTKVILRAKDGYDYPDYWVKLCCHYIDLYAQRTNKYIVVCPIPAKPGRLGRLEKMVDRISAHFKGNPKVLFSNTILRFKQGVKSNKELDKISRYSNIRDHLEVSDALNILGKHCIVIDDVTTTGATLYYADRYLKAAGACSVECMALTQAIS